MQTTLSRKSLASGRSIRAYAGPGAPVARLTPGMARSTHTVHARSSPLFTQANAPSHSVRDQRGGLKVQALAPDAGAGFYRTDRNRAVNKDTVRDFDGQYGGQAQGSTGTAPPPTPFTIDEPSIDELLDELSAEERRTVQLFRRVSPSVVNVSTTVAAPSLFPFPNVMQLPRGVGSGFVWDRQGHIVTNNHVVAGASEVKVTLTDGTSHKAKVIGKDAEKDIAVLQLVEMNAAQKEALSPVTLGSSSRLLVGQKVFAIGNPFGLDQTLTQGIVSGLGRQINAPSSRGFGAQPISNVIQTDAAINPGNSGGPLMDARGRLLGINTAIADPTGVGISSGVGFAIPIDSVKGMVEQILTTGRVMRPAMGITIFEPPRDLKEHLMKGQQGVVVAQVLPQGPAGIVGIQGTKRESWGSVTLGDTITAINGRPVKNQKELFQQLDTLRVGTNIEVTLWRAGTTRTVRLALADRAALSGSYE